MGKDHSQQIGHARRCPAAPPGFLRETCVVAGWRVRVRWAELIVLAVSTGEVEFRIEAVAVWRRCLGERCGDLAAVLCVDGGWGVPVGAAVKCLAGDLRIGRQGPVSLSDC